MSDYFDALMRASGLALDGPIAADAEAWSLEVSEGVEPVPSAREVSDVLHEERRGPARAPAAARAPLSTAETSPLRVPGVRAPSVHSPPSAREISESAALAPAAAASQPPSDASATVESRVIAAGEDAVRAALRWVRTQPSGAEERIAGAAPVLLEPHHPGRAGLDADPLAASEDTASPAVSSAHPSDLASPAQDARALAQIPVDTWAQLAAARVAALREDSLRDEVLEVSIGAIHVRVDAPVPQTVARASVPDAPPPRAPGEPLRTSRSALSRRALRRI